MSEYKSNSFAQKDKKEEELKDVPKVTKPVAKGSVKKQSNCSKVLKLFIAEDTSTMKERIRDEVIIPAVKGLISDTLDSVLYGVTGSKRSRTLGSSAGTVAYNSIYNGIKNSKSQTKASETVARNVYELKTIEFESRGDAEAVIESLCDLIDRYKEVSVADYYDLVGVTGKFTDNKYGWTNLQNASINRSRGIYTLVMPKVKPL